MVCRLMEVKKREKEGQTCYNTTVDEAEAGEKSLTCE